MRFHSDQKKNSPFSTVYGLMPQQQVSVGEIQIVPNTYISNIDPAGNGIRVNTIQIGPGYATIGSSDKVIHNLFYNMIYGFLHYNF